MRENSPLGSYGETVAFRLLRKEGYDIVARNFKGRTGEIDLIAYDDGLLAFIEVKARASTTFGHPDEAVGKKKKQQLRKTAHEFIAKYDLTHLSYRFDIVSILFNNQSRPKIELYKNAF